jgi:hypothetical protein
VKGLRAEGQLDLACFNAAQGHMTASPDLTMGPLQEWSGMGCSGVGLAACPLLARADPPTGLRFEAGVLASHAAASLVMRPITAAFVAHAWAPPASSGTSSGKCPVGFGAVAKDPYTYKVRADRPAGSHGTQLQYYLYHVGFSFAVWVELSVTH